MSNMLTQAADSSSGSVIAAKDVTAPTQVRFGWRDEANPNLVNKEGLLASSFGTDNCQGGTAE